VPDAALQPSVPEAELELVLVLSVVLPSDCALRAVMRLCMKFWNAAAMLLDEEALELDVVAAELPLLDAAALAVELAAVLAVVEEVAPIEDAHSNLLRVWVTYMPVGNVGSPSKFSAVWC
jgi:hypothetical protein